MAKSNIKGKSIWSIVTNNECNTVVISGMSINLSFCALKPCRSNDSIAIDIGIRSNAEEERNKINGFFLYIPKMNRSTKPQIFFYLVFFELNEVSLLFYRRKIWHHLVQLMISLIQSFLDGPSGLFLVRDWKYILKN